VKKIKLVKKQVKESKEKADKNLFKNTIRKLALCIFIFLNTPNSVRLNSRFLPCSAPQAKILRILEGRKRKMTFYSKNHKKIKNIYKRN